MNIKIISTLFLAFCLCFITSCSNNKNKNAKPTITVSIEPLRYFTEKIAGDNFEINTLVPRGSSPETYEPSPRQLISLSQSKTYICIGSLGFEKTWVKKMTENAPNIPIIFSSKGIKLMPSAHHDHKHEEDHGSDPHTWTSPANARIIASNICYALCKIDTAEAKTYKKNLELLISEIDSVDNAIHQMLASSSSRSFIIYHPTLSYFARDYGLRQIPMEEGGKEPSPTSLKYLVETAKKEKLKVILVQKEFPKQNASIISKETGIRIATINPLNYDWKKEMLNIANELKK